jgi:hypothetical protein
MKAIRIFIFLFCTCCSLHLFSQDTLIRKPIPDTSKITLDTARIKHHDPKIATRRSLILPGWGQAYNREYWKIPVVWGALGTCIGFWVYNNTWYHKTKFAYSLVVDTLTSRYGEIDRKLIRPSTGQPLDALSLQAYRNEFRKNRDYSLLYFAGAWALNVADATVFAHLKEFDVSDDLSLKVRPNLNPFNRSAGFSLALSVKQPKKISNYFEAR